MTNEDVKIIMERALQIPVAEADAAFVLAFIEERLRNEAVKSVSFENVVKPVMRWLTENKHPHMSIIIEATRAELVEGIECVATDEFIKD